MNRSRRRAGFTLIELIVVIAVIVVLMSLLTPAVLRMRSTSNRSACQLNLMTIGKGIVSFRDTNNVYPPAWTGQGVNPGWGWGAIILPNIGKKDLHDAAGVRTTVFGGGAQRAAPDQYTQTPVSTYLCPLETGGPLNALRYNHALSNYQATWGVANGYGFVANQDRGGIMFQNSHTELTDVADGESNTFIIGEVKYDEATSRGGGVWAGMTGSYSEVTYQYIWPFWYVTYTTYISVSDVCWWLDDQSAAINGPSSQAFSSRHGQGANFLFADGSVRFVREGGDVTVMKYLASRNDSVPVNFSTDTE